MHVHLLKLQFSEITIDSIKYMCISQWILRTTCYLGLRLTKVLLLFSPNNVFSGNFEMENLIRETKINEIDNKITN